MAAASDKCSGPPLKLLVAAIDFGTTFSGFAYSFTGDYQKFPLKIFAKKWNSSGSSGLISQKTPTTLLLNPQGEFEAFGYVAEERYSQLADDDEHHGWYYFRHFKMILHENENLNRQIEIPDDQGRTLPAHVVFAHCIRYIKNELHENLKKSGDLVQKNEIRWILTVPAIWNESAKQFMREAATEAGIPGNQLTLALEPEAASVYAKEILIERKECEENGVILSPYAPGTKYLVLDLGGGTVDVTVREVLEDRTLKELHRASGGSWGGLRVNDEILNFIKVIFGDDVMEEFYKNHKAEYLDLEREIEIKKRSLDFEVNSSGRLEIKCPPSLIDIYKEIHGQKCSNNIAAKSMYADKADMKKDKLRIKQEIIANFFKPSVEGIVKHLQEILSKEITKDVCDIILVGGFAECNAIREGVKMALPNMRIVVPDDAGLAVLKGAVLYGHNPNIVSARVCKYTYGTTTHRYFIEGHDPDKMRVECEGVPYCKNVFDMYAKAGQTFEIGQVVKKEIFSLKAKMTKMKIDFYRSSLEDPEYVNDKECQRIGTMTVDMPNTKGGRDRKVMVSATFWDTELFVEGMEITGKKVSVTLDLLTEPT